MIRGNIMASYREKILTSYVRVTYKDGNVAVIVLYLPLDIIDDDELKRQFVFRWEAQNLNWGNIETIDDEWSETE